MAAAAAKAGRQVMVGLKKMFFPANEKAKELIDRDDFGPVELIRFEYPQYVPTLDEFAAYDGGESNKVVSFLDHLCHPASLLIFLAGMPDTLYYERSPGGGGIATLTYKSGVVASLAFPYGAGWNRGMERTVVTSAAQHRVVVENNIRVYLDRAPELDYGASPDYFACGDEGASTMWEPEFSLGNLYNKGLFLLGYYGEINEFASAIIDDHPLGKGTLDHARQVTRLFEAFKEGPGKKIEL